MARFTVRGHLKSYFKTKITADTREAALEDALSSNGWEWEGQEDDMEIDEVEDEDDRIFNTEGEQIFP